ncbi:TPA: hypothetical protein ACHWC7_004049 [Providencia stuartii]|uniref:hypothetical protein n=1 Tax=Proteus mirabilis TaxID=584 RepID=UPI000B9FEEA4|nr:hypothetical protein [Proteus mirabilis]OZS64632.1 hypothetical protein CHI96_19035 [Proteus mirabilis]OZS65159.1 hypothetical protein CHI96_16280 [Proteus mirabilis]
MNFFKVKTEHLNNWTDAMMFLLKSMEHYPVYTDEIISQCLFNDWRFIVTQNNEIVFANGVLPAITQADFLDFKRLNP